MADQRLIPTQPQVKEMHDQAHYKCFIARLVRTVVRIEVTD